MPAPATILRLGALLVAALVAASCGGGPGGAAPVLPATQGATAPAPTADSTPPPATAVTPAAAEPPSLATIPHGKTPEGYNYLGSPDAPVTIQDFSDFL